MYFHCREVPGLSPGRSESSMINEISDGCVRTRGQGTIRLTAELSRQCTPPDPPFSPSTDHQSFIIYPVFPVRDGIPTGSCMSPSIREKRVIMFRAGTGFTGKGMPARARDLPGRFSRTADRSGQEKRIPRASISATAGSYHLPAHRLQGDRRTRERRGSGLPGSWRGTPRPEGSGRR